MKKLLLLFSLALICVLNSSLLNALWWGKSDEPAESLYEERDPSKAGVFEPSEFEDFSWEEETPEEPVIDTSKAGMFEEEQFKFDDDDDLDEDWTFVG